MLANIIIIMHFSRIVLVLLVLFLVGLRQRVVGFDHFWAKSHKRFLCALVPLIVSPSVKQTTEEEATAAAAETQPTFQNYDYDEGLHPGSCSLFFCLPGHDHPRPGCRGDHHHRDQQLNG